jgi:hypothetical protein
VARDVGLRVEGLTAALRDLKRLESEFDDPKTAMTRIAQEGSDVMAGFMPSRTGRLRASRRPSKAKARAVVSVGVPYAGPIQWGWAARNIEPAAFFEATDRVMDVRAVQMLEDEINRQISARGF